MWIWQSMLCFFGVCYRGRDALLNNLDYYTARAYVLQYPSATNGVSNIPEMSFTETVFDMEDPVSGSSRRPMDCPWQKAAAGMR